MANAKFDFSGTTTVVTGGASGIGFTCADLIARCGGNVIVSASRNPEKTNQALSKLRSAGAGVKVQAYPCEVGSETSVEQFFRSIRDSGERIDYVINSAGVSPNTDFFEQTQQEWDTVQNTNATGAFLVTKHAALCMKDNPLRGDFRGRILLITSTNGINSQDPVSAHYDSSKAAGNMLVRTAAEFLSEFQICVNALAPGWIETALNDTLPPDVKEKETAKIWMRRWAKPEEMAQCAAHILTMPYYMGQVLMADGGYR